MGGVGNARMRMERVEGIIRGGKYCEGQTRGERIWKGWKARNRAGGCSYVSQNSVLQHLFSSRGVKRQGFYFSIQLQRITTKFKGTLVSQTRLYIYFSIYTMDPSFQYFPACLRVLLFKLSPKE